MMLQICMQLKKKKNTKLPIHAFSKLYKAKLLYFNIGELILQLMC